MRTMQNTRERVTSPLSVSVVKTKGAEFQWVQCMLVNIHVTVRDPSAPQISPTGLF